MPYLFAYLLYYVTKWPVNAAANAAAGERLGAMGNGLIASATHNLSPIASHLGFFPIPCLLHVYWGLHAIHAILAGVALCSWLQKVKGERREVIGSEPDANLQPCSPASDVWPITHTPSQRTSTPSAHELSKSDRLNVKRSALSVERSTTGADIRPLASGFSSIALRLAPWALLALLFYIPGVYLEWPSDPWMHLERITSWANFNEVGQNPIWGKSSYYLTYSLVGRAQPRYLLSLLGYYYVIICLLLCWQYYRLSRACGLGEHASMVFVIIQALLFGNNIFSFYRYYGISSSIYAQLGAIALTRIVLEFAARGTKLEAEGKTAQAEICITEGDALGHRSLRVSESQSEGGRGAPAGPALGSDIILQRKIELTKDEDTPLAHGSDSALQPFSLSIHKPYFLPLSTAVMCLTALTALNHPQGLGIAGLGGAAIVIWRLIEWKRSAFWWLIVGTIVVNALFLWLCPRPTIIETYRSQGWLNSWFGFNIINLTSPAGDRMLQITSIIGLINIAAALALLYPNKIAGWLTVIPAVLLSLPIVAIPYAFLLSKHGYGGPINIISFHRMFLIIPQGLVFIAIIDEVTGGRTRWRFLASPQPISSLLRRQRQGTLRSYGFVVVTSIIALTILLPAPGPYFTRTWNVLSRLPQDLSMGAVWMAGINCSVLRKDQPKLNKIYSPGSGAILTTQGRITPIITQAHFANSGDENYTADLVNVHNAIFSAKNGSRIPLLLQRPIAAFTPASQAALCSLHWNPQTYAITCAGGTELSRLAKQYGYREINIDLCILFIPETILSK